MRSSVNWSRILTIAGNVTEEQIERRERLVIEQERRLVEREMKLEETKERLLALAKKLKGEAQAGEASQK
ncbi:MAG: hypothetical protein AB1665_01065 [Candidatus Thermoplasmatota archaeon]